MDSAQNQDNPFAQTSEQSSDQPNAHAGANTQSATDQPSPTSPTQPPPVDPSQTGVSAPPAEKTKSKAWLILLILIVLIALGGIGGYWFLTQTQSNPASLVAPSVTNVLTSPAVPTPKTPMGQALLFISQGDIMRYDLATQTEKMVTIDASASAVIEYKLPQWLNATTIAYVRCIAGNVEQTQGKQCAFIERNLSDDSETELFSVSATRNNNDVFVGGEILAYDYSPDGKSIAFLSHTVTQETLDFGLKRLHIFSKVEQTERVIDEYAPGGGREGTLDDELGLWFSPDGAKLLLVDTTGYPTDEDNDKGTMQVYDIALNNVIWSQTDAWTTFGKWLNNSTILAKQQIQAEENPGPWNLVKITLTQTDAVIETIAEVPTWYDFELTDANTLVFWSILATEGQGVALEQLNFESKGKRTMTNNVVNLSVLDINRILVRTMKACGRDECPLDIYNGVTPGSYAVYDLASQQMLPLSIANSPATIFSDAY